MRDNNISWCKIEDMINHWANTTENAYLGSVYGGRTILVKYLSAPTELTASHVIDKMKTDLYKLELTKFKVSIAVQSQNCVLITVGDNSMVVNFVETL
jgi:hypothetical protein